MADLNLEEIRDTLVTVAYEAGRMILSANPTDIATDTKLNCQLLISHRFHGDCYRTRGILTLTYCSR